MKYLKQLLFHICYYFVIIPEYVYHPWKKRYLSFLGDRVRVILFRIKLVDNLTTIHVVRGNYSITKYTWSFSVAKWLYSLNRKAYNIIDATGYDPDSYIDKESNS